MTGFISCSDLSEKLQVTICCVNELTTDLYSVIAFLCISNFGMMCLADMKLLHLRLLTEEDIVTNNQNFYFLCIHLYHLISVRVHNLLHPSDIVLVLLIL